MEQEACLGYEGDDCEDMDLDGPPTSVGAYLKQMQEEREHCPEFVAVNVDAMKGKSKSNPWQGVEGLNLVEERIQTEETLIPSDEWQKEKSKEFERNRERISKLRKNGKVNKMKLKMPDLNNEEAWHELLLEKCAPEAKEFVGFDNHIGTPPALPIVLQISPRIASELIIFLVEWSDAEGLTRPIREWIYAMLLIVEFPLFPDVGSSLRDLVKASKKIRASLSPDRIDEANEFSFFVAVISLFFNQRDLSDLRAK